MKSLKDRYQSQFPKKFERVSEGMKVSCEQFSFPQYTLLTDVHKLQLIPLLKQRN